MPPPKKSPPPRRESTISSQIRETIVARRYSASALARASGVDRRALSRWIAGDKAVTSDTLDRVAAALGLRLAEAPGRKSPRLAPGPATIPPAAGLPSAPDAGAAFPDEGPEGD